MALSSATGAFVTQTLGDRIEMVNWSDPERAEQLIDAASTADEKRGADPHTLEVQGMVYAEVHRDGDVDATLAALQAQARHGNQSAVVAEHYVRAYSLYQREHYAAASAEAGRIDIDSLPSPTERYRVAILRGNSLRLTGQAEAALPYLKLALDLAHAMHDDTRILHALLWLVRIDLDTGNLEHASAQLDTAGQLANALQDEAALVEIESCLAVVADRQVDQAAARRASLAALDHAKQSGSSKWLVHALINLAGSYLKSHEYAESLKYSKQALPLVTKLRESGKEPMVTFNQGLAYIGLGNIRTGERLAEAAIAMAQERNIANVVNDVSPARELLRDYAAALEHAGYLMMALQVFHRYDEANRQSASDTRQRASSELSGQYEDERRAQQLELLGRDNAQQAQEMQGQRLQSRLMTVMLGFVACICLGLAWMLAATRKANQRLRVDSKRHELSGWRNRPSSTREREVTIIGAGLEPEAGDRLIRPVETGVAA